MRHTTLALFLVAAVLPIGHIACDPVPLATEQPGPLGCGMRDPRSTGPSLLSAAQQQTLRNLGGPDDVKDNNFGGKDWSYMRSSGSVFGEKQSVEVVSFDDKGLIKSQKTELLRSVGK